MVHTLAIDCGGSGIKGSVLDEAGTMRAKRFRIPTPYPIPPATFLGALHEVASQLPPAERITVGMPGMLRHGVVVHTPHYITRRGPRSRVLPELVEAWSGYDARAGVTASFGMPALVLNDAEVHGAGVVAGAGLEVMLTLGTGLGCAVFDGGRLAPHLEMSHAPVRRGTTFDTYIGDRDRRRIGDLRWSRRVLSMVEDAAARSSSGTGSTSAAATPSGSPRPTWREMGRDVVVVPNSAGIVGGVRAWGLDTG